MHLSARDLREIFALFSSPTEEEIVRVYSADDRMFYEKENLAEEYTLVQEKGEFARDSWRSVISFLYRHGYTITKNDIEVDCRQSESAGLGTNKTDNQSKRS
jgi:hypothetical protein